MSIPVQCPACQHAFAVAEKFAGKKGKCPKCGAVFKAEVRGEGLSVFPAAPPAAPPLSVGAHHGSIPTGTPVPQPTLTDSGPVQTFASVPRGIPIPTTTAPAFTVGAKGHSSHPHVRRPKKTPLPVIIGGAVGALALLGVIIGVVWTLGGAIDNEAVAKKKKTEASSPDVEAIAAAAPPIELTKIDVAALMPLQDSVLALEIQSPKGTTKATCFMVADRTYAVTAAHLLTQATSVEAVTAEDLRIAVSGVAALDAARDLAIIKLEPTLPLPLTKLNLSAAEPIINSDAAAIDTPGAPSRILSGKFKSTDTFAKLSPSLRSKLKGTFGEWADDCGIVQHSIKLSATGIGAPLVTQEGAVIGMQVSADANGGLAVHVRHIAALLATASSDVKPFASPTVATNEASPANSIAPRPPASDDPIDDLVLRIKEHRDACEQMHWVARDEVDYAQFQLLAKFVNEAATGADTVDVPPQVKEKLETTVREALFSLTADKWPEDDVWNNTNRQAAKGLDTPGQGFFALTTVIVPTSQGNVLGGSTPIAVAEIVGQSRMIVLPFTTGGEKFGPGERLLVLGVHDPSNPIQFKNIDVPLIRTKYVLAVQKQD